MDDLISRQDAIKNAHFPVIDDADYEVVRVDDILALPSAEQKNNCIVQIRINRDDMEDLVNEKVNEIIDKMKETKTGEWIRTSNDWIDGTCGARYYPIHCSICNYSTYDDDATNYCPNCGADMRGEKHE